MKNLLNPKWILIIGVLPLFILGFLFFGEYRIIHTLLSDESTMYWNGFFAFILMLIGVQSMYAIRLVKKDHSIHLLYAFVNLIVNIGFLFWYMHTVDELIPFDIPRWMYPDNFEIYGITFLMPTLVHSILILVEYLTTKADQKGLVIFLKALGVPLIWYLGVMIIPITFGYGRPFYVEFLFQILAVTSIVIFLFFIVQIMYLYVRRKDDFNPLENMGILVLITIAFPLIGLWLNQEMGVFGNFSNYWFFIIAFINGVFLVSPDRDSPNLRLFVFLGRSVGFMYILYFLFVFLPYLPLSVVAIIIFGAGFLMLTPLLIFVIQINKLREDIDYLSGHFANWKLIITMVVGFLVIPFSITSSFLNDKSTLTNALEYIYSKDSTKEYNVDVKSLSTALDVLDDRKKRWRNSGKKGTVPFISSYYQWLVLDNMMLSIAKQNKLKEVFMGQEKKKSSSNRDISSAKLSQIKTQSHFDEKTQSWTSWIDLELINESDNRFGIYITNFELPIGAWISDYYLYVGNKREPGILAEKKAANWVFNQIRNENKDPGLLTYTNGNYVNFKVFPFGQSEVRKTGIEIIHKTEIDLEFDGHKIHLGDDSSNSSLKSSQNDGVIYLSSSEKEKLPIVSRKPYFHFLVDISLESKKDEDVIIKSIQDFLSKYPDKKSKAKISLVNYKRYDIDLQSDWENQIKNQNREGGFYIENTIKELMIEDYEVIDDSYPEFVIVKDGDVNVRFPNYAFMHPDIQIYHHLFDGLISAHNLSSGDIVDATLATHHDVLAYPNATNPMVFLPLNDDASIIINPNFPEWIFENIQKDWKSGLYLEGQRMYENLHPEYGNKYWLDMIKNSFKSGIMTPYTSYIVVENEAQKAMLYKKQKEVLNGNKNLDVGEMRSMSEPSIWWFVLGFFAFIVWKRRY